MQNLNQLDRCVAPTSAAIANNNINSQRSSYSHPKNRKNQLVNLTSKILKTSVSYKQGIHPRIFCRRWFDLEAINEQGRARFTEEEIL